VLLILGVLLFVSAGTVSLTVAQVTPSVSLSPTNGIPGTQVTVSLSSYSSSDTSCTISGTPVSNPTACSLSGGSGTLMFTVAQYTPAGSYIITVSGAQASDSGQASFQVNSFSLSLSPASGAVGTEVSFTITNVPLNDTSCSASSQPTGVVTVSACVVNSGSGSGTFVVGNVTPGDYVIEVTACTGNSGCSPSAGDFAQQIFTATTGPTITLSPLSASSGTDVAVSGTGFPISDQSCSISSPTNPAAVQNAGCATTSGTDTVHGSFTVGNVPGGQYVIEVTGCSGNNGCTPSQGNFAQEVLTVVAAAPLSITLNPSAGAPGTTIQVSGTGFSATDTSCTLTGLAVSSASCSISGGVLSGSFTVANVATGYYTTTATGSTGDSVSTNFGVSPQAVPAIPGFPIQAIILGLIIGVGMAILLRKRRDGQN